jgi:hypothetical protein
MGLLSMLPSGAVALEELKGEVEAIKACDKRLCSMVMEKNAKGDDLACSLTKTWAKATIKEAENAKLTWGYGDARCTVDVNLKRAMVLEALAGEKSSLRVPEHTANCIVEQDGKEEKVKAVLEPKITFKDGKADKVWINLKSVDGPTAIKATLYAASELADRLGLFQRRLVKGVNRYIERHCPREHPEIASRIQAK